MLALMASRIQSVVLFCGSGQGNADVYAEAADELGRFLADLNVTLVYGGGSVGLMGVAARACMEDGGQVIGVIPNVLIQRELALLEVTELKVTSSMHERKAEMERLADAFVVMPGGLGTLDETFEILTWSQLGLHRKPVAFFNVNGFFDGLLQFIEHQAHEGFIQRATLPRILVGSDLDVLWEELAHEVED
jgi:hypothetical protein